MARVEFRMLDVRHFRDSFGGLGARTEQNERAPWGLKNRPVLLAISARRYFPVLKTTES